MTADPTDVALGPFLTLRDVLAETGFSETTLYRRVASGAFPRGLTLGRKTYWPQAWIDRWKLDAVLAEARDPATGYPLPRQ